MSDFESLARSVEGHMDRLKADLQQIEQNGVRKGRRTPGGAWEDRTEQAIHDQGNLVTTLEVVLDLILKVRGPRLPDDAKRRPMASASNPPARRQRSEGVPE